MTPASGFSFSSYASGQSAWFPPAAVHEDNTRDEIERQYGWARKRANLPRLTNWNFYFLSSGLPPTLPARTFVGLVSAIRRIKAAVSRRAGVEVALRRCSLWLRRNGRGDGHVDHCTRIGGCARIGLGSGDLLSAKELRERLSQLQLTLRGCVKCTSATGVDGCDCGRDNHQEGKYQSATHPDLRICIPTIAHDLQLRPARRIRPLPFRVWYRGASTSLG